MLLYFFKELIWKSSLLHLIPIFIGTSRESLFPPSAHNAFIVSVQFLEVKNILSLIVFFTTFSFVANYFN
jgi:hypothetical protein